MAFSMAPNSESNDSKEAVKNELKASILARRKNNGQAEISMQPETEKTYELTDVDIERQEKRKASNRKAAKKLRLKKMTKHQEFIHELEALKQENERLRSQLIIAETQRVAAEQRLQEHLAVCSDTGSSNSFPSATPTPTPVVYISNNSMSLYDEDSREAQNCVFKYHSSVTQSESSTSEVRAFKSISMASTSPSVGCVPDAFLETNVKLENQAAQDADDSDDITAMGTDTPLTLSQIDPSIQPVSEEHVTINYDI